MSATSRSRWLSLLMTTLLVAGCSGGGSDGPGADTAAQAGSVGDTADTNSTIGSHAPDAGDEHSTTGAGEGPDITSSGTVPNGIVGTPYVPSPTRTVDDVTSCDLDGDADTDRDDINLILAARNQPASGPDDPRDADGDGLITVNDGRICALRCTLPNCAGGNTMPVADAGGDRTVEVGSAVTLDGSGSTDADGDALSFAWSLLSRPDGSGAELSDPTAVMPTFTADVAGDYVVELVVNDGVLDSAPDVATITAQEGDVNVAPVADAGEDQSVRVGDVVTLDGSGSSDADGDPITYLWQLTTRPGGSNAALSDATVVSPEFTADVAGEFIATLTVSDGQVDSAPDTVRITVAANGQPLADAGLDQSAAVGATVSLDGTGSSDPDGDPLTYLWSFVSRPTGSTASLSGADTAEPTFVVDVAGEYVVQLIVNDGFVDSAPDTVVVTTGNVRPVADAGDDQTVARGDTVTLDGSGSSDADGDPLTYAWSLLSRPTDSTAVLDAPTAVGPSFTADRSGEYIGQLIVNDGAEESEPDTVRVVATNAAPQAVDDSASTSADTDVTIDVLTNDSDPDGDSLTVTGTTQPANGSVTNTDTTVTYSPDTGFSGTDTFDYTVSDGELEATATVTVSVAPGPLPVVSVQATDASASEEGQATGTFTIARTGSTASGLTVNFTVGGSATSGSDYQAIGTSVTIGAGASSATVTVTPIDDDVDENAETVVLTLSANAAYQIGSPASATVSIADNDEPALPVVSVQATDASASEEGQATGTFTIARTGSTASALTVNFTVGGSATSGSDYQAIGTSVTIGAGASSATVTVTPIDDDVDENAETVVLTLSANAAYQIGSPASATVSIADNDEPSGLPVVTVQGTDTTASEETLDQGEFTFTRSGGNLAATLRIFFVTNGSTAAAGVDYTSIGSFLDFPANVTTVTRAVVPLRDNLVEAPETVVVTLTTNAAYSIGTPSTATVTISDFPAIINVQASDATASEETLDQGEFTFTRSGGNEAVTLRIFFNLAGSTAAAGVDYTSIGVFIDFPANVTTVTRAVVPLRDNVVESPETVVANLTPNPAYTIGSASTATVTISDFPAIVSVQATDTTASEETLDQGEFTFTRSDGDLTAALRLFFTTGGSTAAAGVDYTSISSFIDFPPNVTSVTRAVVPLRDNVVESPEAVVVTLSSQNTYTIGSPSTATVTISDFPAIVNVQASDTTASEETLDQGEFTFTRSGGNLAAALRLFYTTSGSTAAGGVDYTSISSFVDFPANVTTVSRAVVPLRDNVVEGAETVVVTLSSQTTYTIGSPSTATVTISDFPAVIIVQASDPNASETGPDPGEFTFTRSGGNVAVTLRIFFSTAGSTAASGIDYTSISTFIDFPANVTSVTRAVVPIDDAIDEPAETVVVNLSASTAYSIGSPSSATVTIADND